MAKEKENISILSGDIIRIHGTGKSEQVRVSFGITIPAQCDQYGSRRVDLELTLEIKKGESPQKAMERVTKEVMSFMGGVKNRRHLGQLEKVIESGID